MLLTFLRKYLSLVLLVIIAGYTYFYKLDKIPIRIWDEARQANNALSMHENNNWAVTYFEGQPDMWNTKPPLLIWLQVLWMKFLGVNEWAVRLPSAIAAFCTCLVLWKFSATYLKNSWIGFLSGLVLATTYATVFNHAGRTGDYDALLVLNMVLVAYAAYSFCETGHSKWMIYGFVFILLGVLTKSISILLFLPGVLLYLLYQKKIKLLLTNRLFIPGSLVTIVLIASFYLLREQYNPGYLKAVYDNELGGRYFAVLDGHQHSFWNYIKNMFTWRSPYWSLFILPAFITGFWNKEPLIKKITFLNFFVTLPYLLIISFSKTKLEWYDLPLYPFFSLQTGILLWIAGNYIITELFPSLQKIKYVTIPVFAVIVFMLPVMKVYNHINHFKEMPWDAEPHQLGYFLKGSIKNHRNLDSTYLCYNGYKAQADFYVRALIHKGSGIKWGDPAYLPDGAEAVACQNSVIQYIEANYIIKTKRSELACTIFEIKGKK